MSRQRAVPPVTPTGCGSDDEPAPAAAANSTTQHKCALRARGTIKHLHELVTKSMMELMVVHGKTKHAVTCAPGATFAALKQQVQEICGVSPASQKLIFKGKERKDAESLAAAGVTNGDKLMLMLSAEGIKELKKEEEWLAGEKRKQEAADAQKLLEEHRAGGAGSEGAEPLVAEIRTVEDDEARKPGAQVVQVIHAKVKYRIAADLASSSVTFLDLKEKLAKLCHVPAKHQRLIFRAKEREPTQTLAAAGVKAGDKMMLLLAEGEWKVRDEKELIRDVQQELADVEGKVNKLKSQCEHGMFGNDTTEIAVKAGMCFEAVERLSDNISYLAHVPEAASVQEALGARLKSMAAILEDLQRKYVLGRGSDSASGGSLYHRLDGPGI